MAFSTTGVECFRSKSTSTNLLASFWQWATNIKVYDTCTTEVVEFHGVDETTAKSMVASKTTGSLSDYRIRSSGGDIYAWMVVPNCKGVISTASCSRVGNSRMFIVTVTTETHTITNSGGWFEY